MPSRSQFSRIDTQELKSQIFRKLGRQKAENYFYYLKKLLNLKLSKLEFEKLMHSTIGKENLSLHNVFIKSILTNACLSHGPPNRQTTTGHSRNNKMSNGQIGVMFPMSPRKGRSVTSRDRRLSDRPSPLGPHGKVASGNAQEVTNSCDPQRSREQTAPEVISIGSKALLEVVSVEDGEEVEQVRGSPGVQSRSPVTAPFGLSFGSLPRKSLHNGSAAVFRLSKPNSSEMCHTSYELPDTSSLRKHLEAKLEHQGLNISVDCVNLLNNGLDAYLKRLISPCVDLVRSRSSDVIMDRQNVNFKRNMNAVLHEEHGQRAQQSHTASLLDFQVAMESNPQLLGGDWPIQLEKICSFLG
ncbi:uncharacterized protein A4U43_C07F29750 [Asparagus officinalis]|uniref:Transcriptional coactivator Hfi1/Transcriptional adapter 1 n=1 Tax=Asparagus officinalis TaxID=4686 RepID=A0A5P1EFZ0_ASPOF|nr:uncharacterized protein LOC109850334 [Asparagus officinalis]XP_020275929.1 uncharacterized protein LOC109850334 [Asparagus officinalis]ONK64772.1 uncharacterized protein A4U43_C07F29750 [Asparagus officinalis]